MKSSSNPETLVIVYDRSNATMLEDLRNFIKNASGHAVEVVLEFPQAIRNIVTPSEKANNCVWIAETLSWEMGRTFLKNNFTSPLREIILTSEFVLDRIKFAVKRLFKSVQESKTLDFEVQFFTSNIRDGVNVHDSDGCVGTFIFSVALEEKIELYLRPYSEPVDKNIVNISITGAPNTGRTFVASIIRKALRDAGIRNVDVSQCGNDIVQLDKQGISAFVLDGIIERGITYVISDNVKKPSSEMMNKRDDAGRHAIEKLFKRHFPNEKGCGYRVLTIQESGKSGVLGVFVKGNKGYNEAIIQEFMNFDATGRNNLVGDEYLSITGFEVKVGFLNRQSELEELKEEFKVDLPEFSDGGCGGWYVLTLVDYAKPAWNPLQFGKQELTPTLTEMPVHIVGGRLPIVSRSTDPDEPLSFQSHNVVGPKGCSFTVGRSKRTPEIFVIGNEGYNDEIIDEFVDMGRAMRNGLVGQSFQIKRGVTVSVGIIGSDADFADIKERFDIDLKALKNVIPGDWWLLKPENESTSTSVESANPVTSEGRVMDDSDAVSGKGGDGSYRVAHQNEIPGEPIFFCSHHHPGPNGFSFTTGRDEHGLVEIFVIGNEGYNHEFIRKFANFGPEKRNDLVGGSFMGGGGVQVSVTAKSREELLTLNAKYVPVITAISKPGINWYVLEPIYK